MAARIDEYILENADGLPILKECCLQNGWDYDTVISMSEKNTTLKLAIKRLQNQKEVCLEKGGIFGSFNKPMAAMLLKDMAQSSSLLNNIDKLAFEKLDNILRSDLNGAVNFGSNAENYDEDNDEYNDDNEYE